MLQNIVRRVQNLGPSVLGICVRDQSQSTNPYTVPYELSNLPQYPAISSFSQNCQNTQNTGTPKTLIILQTPKTGITHALCVGSNCEYI